jgi:hypothetical protein
MSCDRRILEKILSDEETMKTVEDIVKIWDRKEEIIFKTLSNKLKNISFHVVFSRLCGTFKKYKYSLEMNELLN